MLDISFIRENAEIVRKAAENKLISVDVGKLLELDAALRTESQKAEELRTRRNQLSKQKAGPEMQEANIAKARLIKERLSELEGRIRELGAELEEVMLKVPSVPAEGVPVGKGEEDNIELRRVGEIPSFGFAPKDHMELAESLDLVDIPRGVKISGSRFYFLKNEAVLLEMALSRFVMDYLKSRGFTPMSVPNLVRKEAMQGTGYFPAGYDQAYKLPEDELYLIGTSEVPLVSYYMNETISKESFPIKMAGVSTCFRREAGTYGKDTRGLYRVHQFQKVEQVIICEADDEADAKLHSEILSNTEAILQALELPYRVCAACTGELGVGQTRKHEVETWMPSRKAYCETHSCSSFRDFQARRLNIRYRDENGRMKFAYTLNNTAIASPRILIPLLENHQTEDGGVVIPKALRPYMSGLEKITRVK